MSLDFLTEEQLRRYGRYAAEPTAAQLERYFHLDDADRDLIARCRTVHTRLGFAVQLGTVHFLANPAEVPPGVRAYLARQLGIAETEGLGRFATGEKHRDREAAGLQSGPQSDRADLGRMREEDVGLLPRLRV